MIPTMASCTTTMMEQWKGQIAQGHDINVHTEFQKLTADIIARTAFGSSYREGKQVFEMQRQQQVMMNKTFTTVYIPGMRYNVTYLYVVLLEFKDQHMPLHLCFLFFLNHLA